MTDTRKSVFGKYLIMALAGLALLARLESSHPVKADEIQRFEPISQSEWTMHYQFTVFHDKVSGVEFICAINDVHYNPACFPSGRSWK